MITVSLDRSSPTPLYQQLYLAIRKMISAGTIERGEKLPSKRTLATHLKVSVITVESAYAQLSDEGYIYARPGSGFYVEPLLPGGSPAKEETPQPKSRKKEVPEPLYTYDYTTSGTDISSFPFTVWQHLSRETLSRPAANLLAPCPSAGTYELRRAISGYLKSFRGIEVSEEQIVVGAGSEYLAGLVIQLLGRDKIYGIENPGYPKISKIFSEQGAKILPLPLDEQGLSLEGCDVLPDVLHITPAHHFPLGITMPAGRRWELLFKIGQNHGYIIEDDYDSEFRYKGQVVPTLYEMDSNGRVIYLSTFAKLLAPSMRISFMILPPDLLKLYKERLSFYACTVPVFEQLTLAAFIEKGYFERHINRMKKIYRKRRDAVFSAFENSELRHYTEIGGGEAGLHLLLHVKMNTEESELVRRAKEEGVRISGLNGYFLNGYEKNSKISTPCLLLGLTGIDEEKIGQSLKALERAWLPSR